MREKFSICRGSLSPPAATAVSGFGYPLRAGSGAYGSKHCAKRRSERCVQGGHLRSRPARAWYLLLLVPFIALLLPVYLVRTPAIAGIPFFYWYQFALLFVSAGLTAIVYRAVRDTDR
jgi:hypothetical protein